MRKGLAVKLISTRALLYVKKSMLFFFFPELKLECFQVRLYLNFPLFRLLFCLSSSAACLFLFSSSHLMYVFNSERKRHNCTFQQKSSSLYPSHLLPSAQQITLSSAVPPRPAWLHFKPDLQYVLKIKCFAIVFTIKSAWMAVGTIQESNNSCSRNGWGISSSFQLTLLPTVIRCSFCGLLRPVFWWPFPSMFSRSAAFLRQRSLP